VIAPASRHERVRSPGVDNAPAAEGTNVIELVSVTVDDRRLDELLQEYMREWSALIAVPRAADGRFVYHELPAYRDTRARAAWLFVEDGDHARPFGFALARCDDGGRWHVEEHFVIPAARRRGLGARTARALFATRPGAWTLTVRPENPAALAFWRAVAPDADEAVELGDDGVARTRRSFVR
jgi:predicted acetyltransferase